MPEQNPREQDQRRGGYGDSTGGQTPAPEERSQRGTGATGRDNPGTDAIDADEAHGNRTGGYGGNPPAKEGTHAG